MVWDVMQYAMFLLCPQPNWSTLLNSKYFLLFHYSYLIAMNLLAYFLLPNSLRLKKLKHHKVATFTLTISWNEICSKLYQFTTHIEFSFLVFEWIALNIVQSGFHMIYLILYIFKKFSVYRLMLQCWNWWNFSYKYQNLNWKIEIRSPSDRYSHSQQSNKLNKHVN